MKLRLGLLALTLGFYFLGFSQVRINLFAGPQLTSAHYVVNGITQPVQSKLGIIAGIGAKVFFDNKLYFFPSVYYSLKGFKVTLNNYYTKFCRQHVHLLSFNVIYLLAFHVTSQPS